MKRFAAVSLLAALALASPLHAQSFEPFTISDIRVDGLQRISAGTVFTYMPLERGDTVDKAAAARAIRALFRTGFFNDIKLDRQGDILVVTVTERPAINKITLVGNKDIKTEELTKNLKEIGLSEGETFDRLQLDRVVLELTRAYNNRGKYNVSIQPSVTQLDRNRVDVQIDVKEGRAAKIRHINLVGNETFPQKDLREGWESSTTNWLSWYRRDDQYSREKLSGDLEKLNSYYLDRGYVDFDVESTQVSITPDRRDIHLTTNVREGEIFTISEVIVTGDTVIPHEEMEKLVFVSEGQVFSRRLLELTADAMTALLGNIGYAFANVTPVPTVDREKRTVKINFYVEPGKRVQVRQIRFTGNTRTGDEVMRRELRQFEGSWYSQAAIDRSKVRLNRLGFFSEVEVETPEVPGSDDLVDVVFKVTETTSGNFMIGLGYSQLAGLITSLSVTQNNFLGTGNRVGLAVQHNDYSKRYDINYFDPYFTRDGISLGYNLTYSESDYSNFNIASYYNDAGSVRAIFGLPLTETDIVGLSFGVDFNTITPVDGYTPQPIIDYIHALERRTFHAWRTELSWARDSRNAYWNPTRGSYQRVAAEVTLPGSSVEYYKLQYQYARYWPVHRALVLLTNFELGYGDSYGDKVTRVIYNQDGTVNRTVVADGLPFFENFYAGGVRSIRGFEDNTLGPYTTTPFSSYRQPLGGALKTTGTIEAIFPTLFDTDQARLSAFIDFGNVYRNADDFEFREYRASAGVSLQWQAPVGPIVLNLAYPFLTDRDDRTERLQFSFGTQF
ncbi:outer membrane protein assembly factor BamA [Xanthomonadaceae bacterium JHOS43]|nr:outer membrane protein assembly factor BamA [Xanthomonadaceae bacterium JHOS43]MCX7562832.1 outer membrane protein assembly factor BamA [Xanthomonadaceae bacterium XH05]